MLRLDLTHSAIGRLPLDSTPLAIIGLGAPVDLFDLTPRPLGLLRLPSFPVSADDLLTAGGGDFLGAGGGDTLSW